MGEESQRKTLDDLPIGARARVVRVQGDREICRRLIDMGIMKGTRVVVIRNAPLEDPVEIEVMGYRLAVRRAEAAGIEIDEDP